jgi:hypothetical protein
MRDVVSRPVAGIIIASPAGETITQLCAGHPSGEILVAGTPASRFPVEIMVAGTSASHFSVEIMVAGTSASRFPGEIMVAGTSASRFSVEIMVADFHRVRLPERCAGMGQK